MLNNVQYFKCRTCGWIRAYDLRPDILNRVLTHPIYGLVTGRRLVDLDILNHDCDAHLAARSRAIQRKLRNAATTWKEP